MPILNRLTGSPDGDHKDGSAPKPTGSPLVPGRGSRPRWSLAALSEQVVAQFRAETRRRADILLELASEDQRRALLGEVADFVLAVEAVSVSREDRQAVIQEAYRDLFSFGPLDALLADDRVTALTVNGPHMVHVQRDLGAFERAEAAFDDRAHLADVVARMLAAGGAALPEQAPFVEVGAVLVGRAARISVIGPPASPELALDMRLHPRQPVTLDDLAGRLGVLPPQAAVLLRAIVRAGHGLVIVGDVGLGKTTLLGALLRELAPEVVEAGGVIAVERAAELALSEGVGRRVPLPPASAEMDSEASGEATEVTTGSMDFTEVITAALHEAPAWLALDEVRGDEAAAVWQALVGVETAPRYLWVFRGDPRPDRLRSALSMVVRRHDPAIPFLGVYGAIARRLPFVVTLKRVSGRPRLVQIAVWDLHEGAADESTTLDLRGLVWEQDGAWVAAGAPPVQALDLPDGFWA